MTKSPENSDAARLVDDIIDVAQAGSIAAGNIAASTSLEERSIKVKAFRKSVVKVGLEVTDTFGSEPVSEEKEPWKSGMTREQILVIRGLSKADRRFQLYASVNRRRKADIPK